MGQGVSGYEPSGVLARLGWRVFALGGAGGGKAWGIPWVWWAWERLELSWYPTQVVRPSGLLRWRKVRWSGPQVRLGDGAQVRSGEWLAEVHIDNARLAQARDTGVSTWGLVRSLREDLDVLRANLAASGEAKAIHGASLLGAGAGIIGFETQDLPRNWRGRLERFFLVGLDAVWSPKGMGRLRGHGRERWPVEMWVAVAGGGR